MRWCECANGSNCRTQHTSGHCHADLAIRLSSVSQHITEATDDTWQVFDSLAKDLLLGALEGVNATIFAYGQTGSGKTFTVTGGPERYADRGLIPRSIAFLFHSIAQRRTSLHKV